MIISYLLAIWYQYRFDTDMQKTSQYRVIPIADPIIGATLQITTDTHVSVYFSCLVCHYKHLIDNSLVLVTFWDLASCDHNNTHVSRDLNNRTSVIN